MTEKIRCSKCNKVLTDERGITFVGMHIKMDISALPEDSEEFIRRVLGKYAKYISDDGILEFNFCSECHLDSLFR